LFSNGDSEDFSVGLTEQVSLGDVHHIVAGSGE